MMNEKEIQKEITKVFVCYKSHHLAYREGQMYVGKSYDNEKTYFIKDDNFYYKKGSLIHNDRLEFVEMYGSFYENSDKNMVAERELKDKFNDYLDSLYSPSVIFGTEFHASTILENIGGAIYKKEFDKWLDENGWQKIC
jgi:hypothetical protein